MTYLLLGVVLLEALLWWATKLELEQTYSEKLHHSRKEPVKWSRGGRNTPCQRHQGRPFAQILVGWTSLACVQGLSAYPRLTAEARLPNDMYNGVTQKVKKMLSVKAPVVSVSLWPGSASTLCTGSESSYWAWFSTRDLACPVAWSKRKPQALPAFGTPRRHCSRGLRPIPGQEPP